MAGATAPVARCGARAAPGTTGAWGRGGTPALLTVVYGMRCTHTHPPHDVSRARALGRVRRARGYYKYGPQLREDVCELVRREVRGPTGSLGRWMCSTFSLGLLHPPENDGWGRNGALARTGGVLRPSGRVLVDAKHGGRHGRGARHVCGTAGTRPSHRHIAEHASSPPSDAEAARAFTGGGAERRVRLVVHRQPVRVVRASPWDLECGGWGVPRPRRSLKRGVRSDRPYDSGEVIVQNYNTLLTLSHLLDSTDGIVLVRIRFPPARVVCARRCDDRPAGARHAALGGAQHSMVLLLGEK
jgi:hypothetical protein